MSVSDREQSRRLAFGRGVMEGLRMAGVPNPGAAMNAAKLARLESGLNTMAKKVLDAVPIKEPWARDQIVSELRRAGTTPDRSVVDGCLINLCERGLVKQPGPGQYIRVLARQIINIEEIEHMASSNRAVAAANDAPATASGADTLSRLANLGAMLRRAADECDAIALDVEARVQAAGQDGEQLRQLKTLLKSIGV